MAQNARSIYYKRPLEHFRTQKHALETERSSWTSHWRDLADYIIPRRGRFTTSDRNRGDKKNTRIINNTPTIASRTLSSGMMAGLTSPARPWFNLTTPDPEMMEFRPVKVWLEEVERRLNTVFSKAGLYKSLPTLYDELGVFGTAPMAVVEDPNNVIRTQVFTVGEYAIANNERLRVDTFYREFEWTVEQIVGRFVYGGDPNNPNPDWSKVSRHVKDEWHRGNKHTWVKICHAVEPNYGDIDLGLQNDRPYRGVYWEVAKEERPEDVLEKSGFHEFPILCPRWHVTGSDVYGRSPGMDALGDAKQLQTMERRKLQMGDKLANPPMTAPPSMQNQRASVLPGDITYVNAQNGGQKFEPAYMVDPNAYRFVAEEIPRVEDRINRAFYADLFLMLTYSDNRQMTATEVAERHEEKLLALGPVLERLNDELLDPLIDRAFGIMARNNLIPEPPQELEGVDLRVDYISILAQAQRAVGTGAVDRLSGFVGNLASVNPDVLDKMDMDQAVSDYGEMLGVNPKIIRSDDQVQQMRQQRAQAQQAAQAAELAKTGAEGAKTLSEADTGEEGENMLSRLLGGPA